jgi:hypothetical protein
MKKRILLTALLSAAAACYSSDYGDRPPQRGGYGGGGGGYDRPMMGGEGGDGLGALMPPPDWWHDTRLTASMNLAPEQVRQLDKIANGRADEVTKLERDSAVAMRDLRTMLDGDSPASGDIVNAAQRVRTLRNDVFDRQVEMLSAERTLLTKQQWDALESAIRDSRREDRDDRPRGGYGGRGGRGGFPGAGRRPGWGY